jgi:[FeFe] hydrogenase (group B1/B3)
MQFSEVSKLRRKVLAEISRLAFAGKLDKDIFEILDSVVTEDGPRYRCCIHKEKAVLKDRINTALSQPIGTNLIKAAEAALEGKVADLPIVSVLPEACDRCPIDKFIVTDACRNCLAHNCIASCPKKAIMVVQNRAYIDKTKCVECGLCKKSCAYGAIIEVSRPCERACELGAIKAGQDRRAVIDGTKCVTCGACQVSCPYGAISDRSEIVQLIQQLKGDKRVYALLAPAFIGQFGVKVRPEQVMAALKQIGFYAGREVAVGADIVTFEETKEFVEAVPQKQPYMTTSCCPAFVSMVEKHLPEQKDYVSSTVSPMVAVGRLIKTEDPDAVVVFVGPCVAKKAEGLRNPGIIDFVLTFEELAAMFVGADVNVTEIAAEGFATEASRDGTAFARAGGVAKAVGNTAAALGVDLEIKAHCCDGLGNCKAAMEELRQGKLEANFFEGMACTGGCVGGPGSLIDQRVTGRLVETFAAAAEAKTAPENKAVVNENNKKLNWHKG